jgi:hypothetical protein
MKKECSTGFDMEIQTTRLDIQITKTLTEATQRELGTCLAEVKV